MRCPYCGSKMIYSQTQHKNFSAGKAVAGAVVFGAVGVTAGFMGKDTKGYRCSACGSICERTMEIFTEQGIDQAISEAKNGNFDFYNQMKEQYPNIEMVSPKSVGVASLPSVDVAILPEKQHQEEVTSTLKRSFSPRMYTTNCPIYLETAMIKTVGNNDVLSLIAWNHGEKNARSVYIKAKVLDDVGDEINEIPCVYQGVSVAPGEPLPLEKEFDLKTDLAYSVKFKIEKIAFVDDSVWRNNEENQEHELLEQVEILPENFPKYNTLRAMLEENSSRFSGKRMFQPVMNETYTQCICGFPFTNGETCAHCGLNNEAITQMLSFDNLVSYQQTLVINNAKTRAATTERLYNNACKNMLQMALELQGKNSVKSLSKAIEIFKQLPDYPEASDRIADCQKKLVVVQNQERLAKERKIEEEKRDREEQERQRELRERQKQQDALRLQKQREEEQKAQTRKTLFAIAIGIFIFIFSVLYICAIDG